jgi:predicted P-loop ATPase
MGTILWLAGIYGYKCKLKGKVNKNTSYNVLTSKLIERHIYLRLNTLSRRLQIKKDNIWINMNERNLINIALDVFEGKKVKETKEFLIDCSPEVNPAEEFLNKLPAWDKVDRFIQLSDTLETRNIDEKLKLIYLRKWFIGVVNGMLNSPAHGQYNENIIILVGGQAAGKTKWTEKLIPTEYKEYYAVKSIDPQSKDDQIMMSEKFIIFMDESAHLLKTSSADLKSLTSTSKFSVRAPYAAINDDYIRVASLIASSNDYQLLNDTTGNRRFWIIEVEKADFEHKIDMNQLWSEAKYLYDKGEQHWLDSEELKLQAKSVEQYEKINSYEDLINMFIEPGTSKDDFMNATEIIGFFIDRMEKRMPQIYAGPLGSYLIKHGFVKKHKNNKTGYYVRMKLPGWEELLTEENPASKIEAKELFVKQVQVRS